MEKIIPSLSKMWIKVINLKQNLSPKLQESMGTLTPKEEKLIKILDFADIKRFIASVQITNLPKDREEHPPPRAFPPYGQGMARAFVAKQVYNLQTTSALIDRLKIEKPYACYVDGDIAIRSPVNLNSAVSLKSSVNNVSQPKPMMFL